MGVLNMEVIPASGARAQGGRSGIRAQFAGRSSCATATQLTRTSIAEQTVTTFKFSSEHTMMMEAPLQTGDWENRECCQKNFQGRRQGSLRSA